MLNYCPKAVLLFTLFLSMCDVFAQSFISDFEVLPSVEFQNKKKELLKKIIYSDASGHYALYASGKNGDGRKSIRKFDNDFQPMGYRIKLAYTKNAIEPKTIDVIELDNKIYHLWSARSVNGTDYYSEELDLLSKSIKAKVKIASVSSEDSYYGSSKPKIVLKKDSKQAYLLVELVKDKKDDKVLNIMTFDSKMNITNNEKYTFPHDNKNFIIKSIMPSYDNAFVIFGIWFSWEDKDKSIKAREYSYFAYELINQQVNLITEIETKDNFLSSFLAKTKGSELFISGLLSKEKREIPSGLYIQKYDLSKKETVFEKRLSMPRSFYKHPEHIDVTKVPERARDRKKRQEDSNYVPRKLFLTDKDELILLTEQNSYIESSGGGFMHGAPNEFGAMPIMTPLPIYRFQLDNTYDSGENHDNRLGLHLRDDIAIFKFDEGGDLIWSNKVEKQQEWAGTTKYISLFSKYYNNKLFLFYNGNYLNIEGNGDFLDKNDSALLCTVIQENGNYQRQVIHHYTKEYPTVTMPYLSHYADQYGVLLHSRAPLNVKRQKFTRVIIN